MKSTKRNLIYFSTFDFIICIHLFTQIQRQFATSAGLNMLSVYVCVCVCAPFIPTNFDLTAFFHALSDFVSKAFTNTHMLNVFFLFVYFFLYRTLACIFFSAQKKCYSFVLTANNTSPSTSTCLTMQPSLVYALVLQNSVLILFLYTLGTFCTAALH